MLAVLEGLRRNLQHWVLTTEPLKSDIAAGASNLHVRSTRRFKPGDQFLIRNNNEDTENFLTVEEIVDDTHLTITDPLTLSWTVAENSAIVRTFHGGQFFKAIHLGEPDIISQNDLPCITVWGSGKSSEPFAIRTSKERYNIEIGVFVADGTLEDGVRLLLESTTLIERGLKKNFYPLIEDYRTTTLSANAVQGDMFIKVPDSSILINSHMILLENELDTQEFMIRCLPDGQTVRLQNSCFVNFNMADTTVIIPNRFIFNSWPADIKFDKIHKGTLMKAAVINYFAEEAEDQFLSSWYDTQLK
jgi:hypothetical protein